MHNWIQVKDFSIILSLKSESYKEQRRIRLEKKRNILNKRKRIRELRQQGSMNKGREDYYTRRRQRKNTYEEEMSREDY